MRKFVQCRNSDCPNPDPHRRVPRGARFCPYCRDKMPRGYPSRDRRVWGMVAVLAVVIGVVIVVEVVNRRPAADAGADQTVRKREGMTLDGSGSRDADEDTLSYRWTQTGGPLVTLSDTTAVRPTFRPTKAGVYVFLLVVNDGKVDSKPDEVRVEVVNWRPVADVGADQKRVRVGAVVTLDGSGSRDPDGDALRYRWSQTGGPRVTLSGATTVKPTFKPTKAGKYVFSLVVNDGQVDSEVDEVRVEVVNRRPLADAGPDRTVTRGAMVTLDGSGSRDLDGDALTYQWSQTGGPRVRLSGATEVRPTFMPTEPGEYVFSLVVNDGQVDSEADEVIVIVLPETPTPLPFEFYYSSVEGGIYGIEPLEEGEGILKIIPDLKKGSLSGTLWSALEEGKTLDLIKNTLTVELDIPEEAIMSYPNDLHFQVALKSQRRTKWMYADTAWELGLAKKGVNRLEVNEFIPFETNEGINLTQVTMIGIKLALGGLATAIITWPVKLLRLEVVVTVQSVTPPTPKRRTITVNLPGDATMEMVWIEPGTFTMGSPPSEPGSDLELQSRRLEFRRMEAERELKFLRWELEEEVGGPPPSVGRGKWDDENQHEVTISRGFWLGKVEITQAQWESVMGTRPWEGQDLVQENPNYPAVYISWEDVQAFIAKLNRAEGAAVYRLPTEAEWEYACRAGTTTRWSFGDHESQVGDYAWYADNAWDVGEKYAHAVGTKLPNPWRLYDMHGNVWEWCQDWYESYSSSAQIDPTGPILGSSRVVRGGNFAYNAWNARSAVRRCNSPNRRNSGIGARLVRQAQ